MSSAAAVKSWAAQCPMDNPNCDFGGFLSKKGNFSLFSRLIENAYGVQRTKLKGTKTCEVC